MSKAPTLVLLTLLAIGFGTGTAAAVVTEFTSQSSFLTQLTGGFTLVNLDAPPLNAFPTPYRLDDMGPAAALAGLGLDSVGLNAQVTAGNDFQITVPGRDRLIAHGAGNGGLLAFNFLNPVNGVGAISNVGDGGQVRAFSGANLGGTFLGDADFGNGGFGGLISTDQIRSVQFTCTFNADLRCGVIDVQFGTVATTGSPVPEPASWILLLTGAGLLAARRRLAAR